MDSTVADDPTTMTCGGAVIEEFQSDRVGLGYNRPSDFLTPQWPCRKRWYLLYRAVVALTFVSWTIGDMVYETETYFGGSFVRWFLYATNWRLMLLTLSTLLQAVTSAMFAYKSHWVIDPQFCRSMPLILRFQWMVLNLAYNSAFVVTTAYWGWIVFIIDDLMLHRTTMNQVKHTANTIYVLLDLMVMATPFRLFHMFFSITLGSCYVLFNGIFFLNGHSLAMDLGRAGGGGGGGRTGAAAPGTTTGSSTVGSPLNPSTWTLMSHTEQDAYNYLNWHAPVEAIITCVMAMFLCVLAQVLLFLLFRLRLCVWQKLYGGAGGWRMESELQNIVMSQSSSYNTIDGDTVHQQQQQDEAGPVGEKKTPLF